MPTYAPIPAFADRRAAPKTLTIIVAAHAVAIAAVMTAKMELPQRILHPPIVIEPIPIPQPPPPEPQPQTVPQPSNPPVSQIPPVLPVPTIEPPIAVDPLPPLPLPPTGPAVEPPPPAPLAQPIRTGPRFATPDWALKPPYPEEKRRTEEEEEAVLKLKLSIDARGRVVAVEPVGKADPVFLAAARKHLFAHWRYKPATEGGRAIASATVIALRFELED